MPPSILDIEQSQLTESIIKFKANNSVQIYQLPYYQDKTIQEYKQDLSIRTKYQVNQIKCVFKGRVLLDQCKVGELKLSNCTVNLLLIKLKKDTDGQQKLVFSPFVPARCRPNYDKKSSAYNKNFEFLQIEQKQRREKEQKKKVIKLIGSEDKNLKIKQVKLDKKRDKNQQLQKFMTRQMPLIGQNQKGMNNFFTKFMQTPFFEQVFGQILNEPSMIEKLQEISPQLTRQRKLKSNSYKTMSQSQTIVALDMQALNSMPKIKKMIERGCSQQQIAKALQTCEFEVNGKVAKVTKIQSAKKKHEQMKQKIPNRAQMYKRMIELQDMLQAEEKSLNYAQLQKKRNSSKSITNSKQSSSFNSKIDLIKNPVFQKTLQDLSDLGFKDKQLNTKILFQEGGNLQCTLNRLCLGL